LQRDFADIFLVIVSVYNLFSTSAVICLERLVQTVLLYIEWNVSHCSLTHAETLGKSILIMPLTYLSVKYTVCVI